MAMGMHAHLTNQAKEVCNTMGAWPVSTPVAEMPLQTVPPFCSPPSQRPETLSQAVLLLG